MTRALPARVLLRTVSEAHGVPVDAILSRSRRPCYAIARGEAVRRLRDESGWTWGQLANIFNRDRSTCRRIYATAKLRGANDLPHYDAGELRAQLRRLSGASIVDMVSDATGAPFFQAQFIAVLIEAYPRILSTDALCELYDASCECLGIRDRKPADDDLVRQFLSRSRKWFEDRGMPAPAERPTRIGIRLTTECAQWMQYNIGYPVTSAPVANTIQISRYNLRTRL